MVGTSITLDGGDLSEMKASCDGLGFSLVAVLWTGTCCFPPIAHRRPSCAGELISRTHVDNGSGHCDLHDPHLREPSRLFAEEHQLTGIAVAPGHNVVGEEVVLALGFW